MISLKLYIAGQTARSILALNNIKKLTLDLPANAYQIDIVDLLKNPELASIDAIIAIPTTVRTDSEPTIKVVGDLSNLESARLALNIYNA
ncbi:MAG: circadian clock KaiB family protein [Pseudomonadota bacterium]